MTLTGPFFTALDSRAAIRGSRDPLGVQPIWARLGRQLVGNLTTVSTSVRDFVVLLLGYALIERVADVDSTATDLATFLKWEQLAAYARDTTLGESGYRGVERVKRRLAEGERVPIGVGADAQILGDQKTYGLWGLYTAPARASGLLDGEPTRLTSDARRFVERNLLPTLEAAGERVFKHLIKRLRGGDFELSRRPNTDDGMLLTQIAKAIEVAKVRPAELSFLRDRLLHGGPGDLDATRGTFGRQRVFAELLTTTLEDPRWTLTPVSMNSLATVADRRAEPVASEVARRIRRIRHAEQLLAPSVALFEYVLACGDQPLRRIVSDVRGVWSTALASTIAVDDLDAMSADLRGSGDDATQGRRWTDIARSLAEARYRDAIRLLVDQHAAVMTARSGAGAWLTLTDEKVTVKLRDEQAAQLPPRDQLVELWRHSYFIESMRSIARGLRRAP